MAPEGIAQQVMDYARKHYNEGGWDSVVECFTQREIEMEIEAEGCTSVEAAIEHYTWVAGLWAEQDRAIKAEVF